MSDKETPAEQREETTNAAEEQVKQEQEQGTKDEQSAERVEAIPVVGDVYTVLRVSLGLFLQQAWISLGLRTAPGATETKTDLQQARVAIDTAAYLFDKLRPVASEEEQKEVELELTNLRINFARKAE